MNEEALILFVKNPAFGKVKTRLAATVGAPMALRIYQALLLRLRQTAEKLPFRRYAFFSDENWTPREWPEETYQRRIQIGEDIGIRMHNAFAEVLSENRRAILVGSDIPGLTTTIIKTAFKELKEKDLVLGPARDGGYYLIGLKAPCAGLFEGISWSTKKVLEQTLQKAKQLGLSYALLPTLSDVDYEEDWLEHGWDLDA